MRLCIHQELALDKEPQSCLSKALSQLDARTQLDARKLGPKARDPQRKAPTRPSCAPTKAYNPIRFTLPSALTPHQAQLCANNGLQPYTFHSSKCSNLFQCRAAGLLLIQFTKNHTRHWLNIASIKAINFAKYPPSQRHTFTIAAARHLLCNFRRHCPQQTLAILECVYSGKLISKLISHASEAGSDSTNCDKGVFKSNRLPPLSLKHG